MDLENFCADFLDCDIHELENCVAGVSISYPCEQGIAVLSDANNDGHIDKIRLISHEGTEVVYVVQDGLMVPIESSDNEWLGLPPYRGNEDSNWSGLT